MVLSIRHRGDTDWEYVYAVPEPATLATLVLGVLGALLHRRRK